jgi:hypothetical protein
MKRNPQNCATLKRDPVSVLSLRGGGGVENGNRGQLAKKMFGDFCKTAHSLLSKKFVTVSRHVNTLPDAPLELYQKKKKSTITSQYASYQDII